MLQQPLPASASVTPDSAVVLESRNLHKVYRIGDSTLEILVGADLSVRQGEFIAIEGRSGSGKSTLLHILGALDESTSGSVIFDGQDISLMSPADRCALRNRQFGFVFQFYHLLPELNVLENAMLAPMIEYSRLNFRANKKALRQRAIELLEELEIAHRLTHRPQQLSGGERQRVAIARALMSNPRVLFADEPTGNLDEETGRQIMGVLERLHRDKNQTIIMVTHDRSLARQADRTLILNAGRLSLA